ncbi:hypothetical protein EC12264_4603 [Escherichia coli 1.2264]|nr:hypothetical protein EC12264_4603 [Escherichia coli 1.2264]
MKAPAIRLPGSVDMAPFLRWITDVFARDMRAFLFSCIYCGRYWQCY